MTGKEIKIAQVANKVTGDAKQSHDPSKTGDNSPFSKALEDQNEKFESFKTEMLDMFGHAEGSHPADKAVQVDFQPTEGDFDRWQPDHSNKIAEVLMNEVNLSGVRMDNIVEMAAYQPGLSQQDLLLMQASLSKTTMTLEASSKIAAKGTDAIRSSIYQSMSGG
jgi:hypothetical protein